MSLYLLLMLTISLQIIASPLSPVQQLSLTNSSDLVGVGEVHCTTTSDPFALRSTPVYADCLLAIAQLPHSSEVRPFHRSGPDDLYKLPVIKVSGTCAVLILLNTGRGATTACTWTNIAIAAIRVNSNCVSSHRYSRKTGGWTDLGAQGPVRPPPVPVPIPYEIGRIQVSLFHPDATAPMQAGLVNRTLEHPTLTNITTEVETAT